MFWIDKYYFFVIIKNINPGKSGKEKTMRKFFDNIIEALELQARVLSDTEPAGSIDAALIFGETSYNEASVFSTAVLLKNRAIKFVYASGGKLLTGEEYISAFDQQLIWHGIPREQILRADISSKIASTRTEAVAFVELAKHESWSVLTVTAAPFHQLRAFANTVTLAVQQMPHLKVFSVPGKSLPWTETVVHSQNIERGRRCDLIKPESKRLEKYRRKTSVKGIPDLLSAREILDYLDRR